MAAPAALVVLNGGQEGGVLQIHKPPQGIGLWKLNIKSVLQIHKPPQGIGLWKLNIKSVLQIHMPPQAIGSWMLSTRRGLLRARDYAPRLPPQRR